MYTLSMYASTHVREYLASYVILVKYEYNEKSRSTKYDCAPVRTVLTQVQKF